MNTTTKIILIVVMFACTILWNIYGQPQLDGTQLAWFPIAQVLYVPILFGICSFIYKKKKYPIMKQLLLATIMPLSYVLIGNAFSEERLGYIVATLCGSLIVYLALLINKSRVSA